MQNLLSNIYKVKELNNNMKNPPVLTIGNRAKEILSYINNKKHVRATEIYDEFNLNGNGIYIKQLLEKGFIEKIERGKYKITENGKSLLELINNMENQNETIQEDI